MDELQGGGLSGGVMGGVMAGKMKSKRKLSAYNMFFKKHVAEKGAAGVAKAWKNCSGDEHAKYQRAADRMNGGAKKKASGSKTPMKKKSSGSKAPAKKKRPSKK